MSAIDYSSSPDSEASTLFNPAFCAVLLNKISAAYELKSSKPMPVLYAFLILPSVLHKPTRDALPATVATSMWAWLRANPVLIMDHDQRARDFRQFTATAITYGMQHNVLLGSAGELRAQTLRRRPRTLQPTEDWIDCLKASEFLGKWFGGLNTDQATTLAFWGVRP